MIIDGVVFREGHPSWCTCDECETEHPGKRAFFLAEAMHTVVQYAAAHETELHEDDECGDCGSTQMLWCSRCGMGHCMACNLIGGTSPAEAMADHQGFLAEHAHREAAADA